MKQAKREKVLVTGGAGFIGSHIVDLLIMNGYELVIVDDLSRGKPENINSEAQFYQIDINDPELKKIFNLEKPDYICHQAAQISVSFSVKNPKLDAQSNIMGLLNLLELSLANKVKGFIFASSGGTIYGECTSFPIKEDSPLCPNSPYGISKMTSEYYLNFYYHTYQLNYISLRYGNVYGPRQDPYGEAGVIAIFINKMLNNETPIINGDGDYIRDYVFVKDVAEACLLSIENMLKLTKLRNDNRSKNVFNAFNIATGEGVSVNQLFSYLQKIIGFTKSANYGPPRPGDLRKSILDYQLAEQYLGWKPKYHLPVGLKETVEWFKLFKKY
ncbi:MAG: NAD-dependent epimerase/dehydratase family protein [Candidatus Atribacteria bacterium]|nr:NAD-dependent epimerase/dehydratase family protein [Candidatus Atribacteria bacterium]